jgi:hypothetical protein
VAFDVVVLGSLGVGALDRVAFGVVVGGDVMRLVERFLGRFIAYPSEHARLSHTLWIAHPPDAPVGVHTADSVPEPRARVRQVPVS